MSSSFRRGTTPRIPFSLNADLTGANLYLSFKQDGRELVVKENDTLSVTVDEHGVSHITCPMTQEDTLRFKPGMCEVQLRWALYEGDEADATSVEKIDVLRILQEGVIK